MKIVETARFPRARQRKSCIISAKAAEIIQTEPFAVRLAGVSPYSTIFRCDEIG